MPPWNVCWPHVFTGKQVVTDMRVPQEGNYAVGTSMANVVGRAK